MVGNARPRGAEMNGGRYDVETAHVDAIEAKNWKRAGEAFRRSSRCAAKHLSQAEPLGYQIGGRVAPVIEVAGDDERCFVRHQCLKPRRQFFQLSSTRAAKEREMDADAVQWLFPSFDTYGAVKQSAALEAKMSDILIVGIYDREARKDGIAVMAVIVNDVTTVRGVMPDFVGEEFVLRLLRPFADTLYVAQMQTLHLLQEDDVRRQSAKPLAQLMDHHAPVELRESLVNVVGGDVQGLRHAFV